MRPCSCWGSMVKLGSGGVSPPPRANDHHSGAPLRTSLPASVTAAENGFLKASAMCTGQPHAEYAPFMSWVMEMVAGEPPTKPSTQTDPSPTAETPPPGEDSP